MSNINNYYELFKDKEDKTISIKLMKEAYRTALEMRKIELELYWKRATYFFVFITATLAGIYFVFNNSNDAKENDILTLCLSIFGQFVSLGWLSANRGGKFWIENWEKHVDLIEDYITGPLYKSIFNSDNYKKFKFNQAYPFSVTKINHIISFVVSILFLVINLILFKKSIFDTCKLCTGLIYLYSFLSSLAIYISIFYIYYFFSKSPPVSNDSDCDKDGIQHKKFKITSKISISCRNYSKTD